MHLEIEDVSFSYRSLTGAAKPVITNLTWDIDTGITGLLGPNGCGKTTLMRIIDRSLRESSGVIRANGIRIKTNSQVAKFRRGLGIMPQNPDFVPWMTVEGTLEYLAWVHKIPHRELKSTVAESIEKVDLVEQATQPVRSLSGGQQRRLAFACATLGEPSLLLLDEPTAGLDPSARLAIRELIHRQGQSSTVLISTHLLEDVAHLCPQLGIMRDGRIAYSGPYDAIAKRIRAQDGSIGSAFEQAYERIIHDAGEVIER